MNEDNVLKTYSKILLLILSGIDIAILCIHEFADEPVKMMSALFTANRIPAMFIKP